MSEKIKGTRTRAANFTKQDQILLFDALKPYTHIIESKLTDSVKQADKQIAWSKITEVFNSNAVGQPRTIDNLISCYRNIKSKIKKQHSEAKMMIVDPAQRGALLRAIEEDGKDWQKVASTSKWNDPNLCEQGFEHLRKESLKQENRIKKVVMGTGGGPLPPNKNEDEFAAIKKLIEPQIDGLFTIYDSDANLMAQYQQTQPEDKQVQPIESSFIDCTVNNPEFIVVPEKNTTHELEPVKTPQISKSRIEIIRKKKEHALTCNETTNRKATINESFKQLSEAKLELVQMQKLLLEKEFIHKQRIQEIEMQDIILENKFKEKMREKELELMDAKIHNVKNNSSST